MSTYGVTVDARANLKCFEHKDPNPRTGSYYVFCKKEDGEFITINCGLVFHRIEEEEVPPEFVLKAEFVGPQR